MTSILDQIVAAKRQQIQAARSAVPETQLRAALEHAPDSRDFRAALAAEGPIKLIAEVKKASPSKGLIRADFEPVHIARTYQQHGASCLSVLTDEPYFQGSLEYLRQVRHAVQLPVLRKDFIIDAYQLYEARAAGADAVLLIAECLDDGLLHQLHRLAAQLQMAALVEFYEPENLPRVLDAGATLVGINNRDLRTFQTDLEHTLRLLPRVPESCLVVAESGIRGYDDVQRLSQAGVDAILVGEYLMASRDIGAAVDSLLGR